MNPQDAFYLSEIYRFVYYIFVMHIGLVSLAVLDFVRRFVFPSRRYD